MLITVCCPELSVKCGDFTVTVNYTENIRASLLITEPFAEQLHKQAITNTKHCLRLSKPLAMYQSVFCL